ncbi:ABC transporter permease family protein [Catenuloplanes japonicus]|uniref:FtsX-like permease family protein n=1 Tax=Catenuloplanes japonicus TaxID=33876 RepID=UPI0005276FB9|nr:FtsX-like permease family protein [Catenuloplanes japonicus]
MLTLIVRDFAANLRIWVGALLVAAATAAVGTVVAAEIQTAVEIGGMPGLALASVSGTVLLFGTVAAMIVLSSVTTLTVSLQQRAYALWQLIGIRPGHVRLVVTAQLVIVAVLGGIAGCLAAAPGLPALFRFVFADATGMPEIHPRFGVVAALGVLAFVVTVVLTAGGRAARRAAGTAPIDLLRRPDTPDAGLGAGRWIAGLTSLALATLMISTLPSDPEKLTTPLMALAPLTAGALAAFGPVYLAPLIRLWTALVPARVSGAWFLARHTTADHLSRSTAAISPLMVAVALAGGLYAADGTANTGPGLSAGTAVLLAGGPLLLSVLGAAVTVLMSGQLRSRESALVRAAGATTATVLGAAAAEAVIYAVTATALGAIAVAVTAIAGGLAAGVVPSPGLAATGTVAASGLLLMTVATVAPAAAALRRPVPRALATE